MTVTSAPPPGWYPDPAGSGGGRYWDGTSWTATTYPPASVHPPSISAPVRPDPKARRKTWIIASLTAAALIGALALSLILSQDSSETSTKQVRNGTAVWHPDTGAGYAWAATKGAAGDTWGCIPLNGAVLCSHLNGAEHGQADVRPGPGEKGEMLSAFNDDDGLVFRYDPQVLDCPSSPTARDADAIFDRSLICYPA